MNELEVIFGGSEVEAREVVRRLSELYMSPVIVRDYDMGEGVQIFVAVTPNAAAHARGALNQQGFPWR